MQISLHDVAGAPFGFQIGLADVFADDADGQKLQAADGPDRDHDGGPPGNGMACPMHDEKIQQHQNADGKDQQP